MKSIVKFLEELLKIPTKQRRKYIKHFVGNDRQAIYDLLEMRETASEQELLDKWNGR